MTRTRRLVACYGNLDLPPTKGAPIHLTALAEAAAAHVPTHLFAWCGGDPQAFDTWVASAPAPEARRDLVECLDPADRSRSGVGRRRVYLQRVAKFMESHAAPGSVVWVRGPYTALAALPWIVHCRRRRRGWRFVYDAASFTRLEHALMPDMRTGPWMASLEEWGMKRFDFVRTLAPCMADYLRDIGVHEEKIWVLPVGASPPPARWPGPSNPAVKLLYSGSARAWQGLSGLFDAMRLLWERRSPLRLRVLGVTREELTGEPPANVEIVGRVPHADVARYYLESDLLVVPRPRLPLTDTVVPMKVAEAMALGIPMAATRLRPIEYVAGEGGAFWVDEPTPAAWAAALEDATRNPDRLWAVSERAQRRFDELFDWQRLGRDVAAKLFSEPVHPRI